MLMVLKRNKKSFIITMLVILYVSLFATSSYCADVTDATIRNITDDNGTASVRVSSPSFPTSTELRKYYLQPAGKNAQLAILLTALSLEKTVFMSVADLASGSLVISVSLINK